ncbi:MAG TPA: hypothetical protein VNV44_07740 [Solirubrobacteraceae bacterium]|jgi:hypothetical protein|nr:hypothetical protein [Solirubrobacteraceae bacterium]
MLMSVSGHAPSVGEKGPSERLPAARARRRLGWLAERRQRRQRPAHPSVSPVVVEEEAASLLYGERTGTVHASPAAAPVGEDG